MARWDLQLRKGVSWCVVVLGLVLGIKLAAQRNVELDWVAASGLRWTIAAIAPGVMLIFGSVLAIRNPRLAARLILICAVMVPLLELFWLPEIKVAAKVGLVGLYWWLTSRYEWPALSDSGMFRAGWRFASIAGAVLVVGVIVASVLSLRLSWTPHDCAGMSILGDDGLLHGTVFTARITYVPPPTERYGQSSYSRWAIARVEHRYSDQPSRAPDPVILKGDFQKKDEGARYLVEGRRCQHLLTLWLPIIEPCWHTRRVEDAAFELRILDAPKPTQGARIIGRAYSDGPRPISALVRAAVLITGPKGTFTVVTDSQGTFDVEGLPPGHYKLELQGRQTFGKNSYELVNGQIVESDLYVPTS